MYKKLACVFFTGITNSSLNLLLSAKQNNNNIISSYFNGGDERMNSSTTHLTVFQKKIVAKQSETLNLHTK